MKLTKKKPLIIILTILLIISSFTSNVLAEDNASSGDGSTGTAGANQGYYSSGQYMWKVSLYIASSDQLTTQSDISKFYLVGNQSVYIRPLTCTVYSTSMYGAYNKVQYLSGCSLSALATPTVMADINCPIPPVVYPSGNLDTVKSYFGSTQTMVTILDKMAIMQGTTPYGLVSGLSITIGGKTKTGWSAEYLLPSSAMTNRIAWVVIYEPVVIAFLRDGSKMAFTATEYAIAQMNGWYNFCNRADNPNLVPQYLQALTRNVLPASVKLEESWFGYGVYNSTYNEIWTDINVFYYGGWGMRWLPVSILEPKVFTPEYSSTIVSTTIPVANGYGNVKVQWDNFRGVEGTVSCEIVSDDVVVMKKYITITPYGYVTESYSIYYSGTATRKITARINYEHMYDEQLASNNIKTVYVTPTAPAIIPDFAITSISATPGTVYQGYASTVTFTAKNNTSAGYSNIPILLTVNGQTYKAFTVNFTAYESKTYTYDIVMEKLGTNTVTATINNANKAAESNTANNTASTSVTVNPYYDFAISNLAVTPQTCYENESVVVTFRTDNNDTYNAYNNIPVELLYNGKLLSTTYVNYGASAAFNHEFTVNVGTTIGINTISVRVNDSDRMYEVNINNNAATTSNTVNSATDLTIEPVAPNATYNEGTEVITTYYVYNNGSRNILPGDFNSVVFQAYYYKATLKVPITTASKTEIVIPKNGSNLVYFKWTVPDGIAGKTVYCTATVNSSGIIPETDKTNNTATLIQTIGSVFYCETPPTKYERDKGSWMMQNPTYPVAAGSTSWAEWVYVNGAFQKKLYGINANAVVALTPDINSPSDWQTDGVWYMRSGYGYSVNCSVEMSILETFTFPDSNAYTGTQNGIAYFPEFCYRMYNGACRTLELADGYLQFYPNPQSYDHYRVHFTPIWFPSGSTYTLSCKLYDIWTPAGMLTTTGNGSIEIRGNVYDDYYIRHG